MTRHGLLGAVALALLMPGSASAATYSVSDTNDTPAGVPCGGFTDCSLREAVTSANANPGADTILVIGATYPLVNGELPVTGALTVARTGASGVDIQPVGSRAFAASAPLTLRALEISGASASAGAVQGGAVLASDDLTLDEVRIDDSRADGTTTADGGAVAAVGPSLTVIDSRFADNTAEADGGSARGGALYAGAATATTISGSTFTGNEARTSSANIAHSAGGGAIVAGGAVSLADSVLRSNAAESSGAALATGGAMRADGADVEVTGSLFETNSAHAVNAIAYAGALDATAPGSGTLTITASRFSANDVSATTAHGGALRTISTDATISRSTFDGNVAASTANSALGGAAMVGGGGFALENSTVTGNLATASGAGAARGGGVYFNVGGTVTSATVTANRVAAAGGAEEGGGFAGGGSTVTITGSILSANEQAAADADCALLTLESEGGNVVNQADGATGCAYAAAFGDVITADPQLGALADNGGPTPTMLPAVASPALDRYTTGCPAVDQRGVARPQGPACDAGAAELRPPTVTPGPGSLAFADRMIGEPSGPQTVTLSNDGEVDATGLSLGLAGAHPSDFALTSDTCSGTLAAGASCTVDVTFTPAAAGARTAQLIGPDTPVGLAGTGLAPPPPPPPPTVPAPACAELGRAVAFGADAAFRLRCTATTWRWQIVEAPRHGSLSEIARDGTVVYTPDPGWSGHDAFRYRALGPGGASAPAIARVTVAPGPPAGPPAGPPSGDDVPIPTEPPLVCGRVPDLTGRTVPGARRLLARIGCGAVPLSVTRKGGPGDGRRRIVRQSPEAGAPLFEGDRLRVVARPASRRAG